MLARAAAADLREIARYTRQQWGTGQARIYLSKLDQGIERLVAGEAPYKDLSALYPSLRMTRCERHFIFCRLRHDAPALVVALFHERMDLMVRLTDRLAQHTQASS